MPFGAPRPEGIGVGFWTEQQALVGMRGHAGDALFEPRVSAAAADRRHAKWKKAVERALALADLTEPDDEPGDEA